MHFGQEYSRSVIYDQDIISGGICKFVLLLVMVIVITCFRFCLLIVICEEIL